MERSLEDLVQNAVQGDENSLESLMERIRDPVYGLALRMLWHPEDADDATQEILIRILTHLASFRAESSFMTWCYRVASNYLLTTRKRRAEAEKITFHQFGLQLDEGIAASSNQTKQLFDTERAVLEEEMKIGCTHGMLLCLDREHRLTYILGEILEMDSAEGSEVMNTTPATFRQRLLRSRKTIHNFMMNKCGLVNPENACRCSKRIDYAIRKGRIDPDHLLFAAKQRYGGAIVAKAKAKTPIQPNTFYHVKVTFDGMNFTLVVNQVPLITMPAAVFPNGTVGFRVKNTTGRFGSISVSQ